MIRPGAIYQLAGSLDALPENVKLRNIEWGILFAVTGIHTVGQIAQHFEITPNEANGVFERLVNNGLVTERPVSYGEYLKANATVADDEPKSLARFLSGGPALRGGPEAVTNAPQATAAPASTVARILDDAPKRPEEEFTRAVPTVPPPSVPFKPLATEQTTASPAVDEHQTSDMTSVNEIFPDGLPANPNERDTAPPLRLSLKKVMQLILQRAADLQAGQLDVYRVFIRVNTKLLRRNGITTLRFEEDRIITDPELQEAIVASMEKALGLKCPQEAFV